MTRLTETSWPDLIRDHKANLKGGDMETNLKPCPFCGGAAKLHIETGVSFVACLNVGGFCRVEPCTPECYAVEYAIEAWNKREGE